MKKKLWKGNLALAEGAIAGGMDAYFGYPITPQNEIPEHLSYRMRELGRVFLQSESELAAINMVMGAAITGKKAMTTSSSPGISLMQESLSYIAGCELPAVIANVQRGGPGLGNISGAQSDYFQSVKGGGHGDYRMIVLAPASVQDMYDMGKKSFSLAFKYRNPVMILSDGIIGQMIEPADISPVLPGNEISSESVKENWNLDGCRDRHPRFIRSLYMGDGELEAHNYKLLAKYESMKIEVDWEELDTEDAEIILVGYGAAARLNLDIHSICRKRKNIKTGYFRLKTLYPFPSERLSELSEKAVLIVVEMSAGQLIEDVLLCAKDKSRVFTKTRPGGKMPDISNVLDDIEKITAKS